MILAWRLANCTFLAYQRTQKRGHAKKMRFHGDLAYTLLSWRVSSINWPINNFFITSTKILKFTFEQKHFFITFFELSKEECWFIICFKKLVKMSKLTKVMFKKCLCIRSGDFVYTFGGCYYNLPFLGSLTYKVVHFFTNSTKIYL